MSRTAAGTRHRKQSGLGLFAQNVLNALSSHIAVLDRDGTIVAVNEAWNQFGRDNGAQDPLVYARMSYLDACDAAARNGCRDAAAVGHGIRAVLEGKREEFLYEYDCSIKDAKRWFVVTITRFNANGVHAVVAHRDVTAQKVADETARTTGELLRKVLETMPVGVWILDGSGNIIDGNPAGRAIWRGAKYVGPDQYGVYKAWWLRSGVPIEPDEWAAARAISKGEVSIDEEILIECFDGSRKAILNSSMPLRNESGEITGAIIVNQDIDKRIEAEKALHASNLKWRTLFEILPTGVVVLDREGLVVDMNESIKGIIRMPESEIEGGKYKLRPFFRPDGTKIEPQDLPGERARLTRAPVSGEDVALVTTEGETLWLNVCAAPMPFDDASAVVVVSDVTAQRNAEAELRRANSKIEAANEQLRRSLEREALLARTDALTGVSNRRHFFEVAEHVVALSRRYGHDVSVVIFDIDRFKQLNDRFGHAVGDEVLRGVAERANGEMRSSDLVSRYGGEEFVALLPQTDLRFAFQVAERIRLKISSAPFAILPSVTVMVSAGVAQLEDGDVSVEQLISRADDALYRAKSEGRNRTVAAE